jgi:hypothetical protein
MSVLLASNRRPRSKDKCLVTCQQAGAISNAYSAGTNGNSQDWRGSGKGHTRPTSEQSIP